MRSHSHVGWLLLAVLVLGAAFFLLFPGPTLTSEEYPPGDEDAEWAEIPPPALDIYGLEEEAYHIEKGRVRSRQTLAHILADWGVGPVEIDRIARELTPVFNPRRIRAGQTYQAYFTLDSLSQLAHFVYEITPLEFFRIDLGDSLTVNRATKEITSRLEEASGVIHSSLWNTVMAQDLSPELVIRMSEVLAWEVDFHRIERGDAFRVLYHAQYVDGDLAGVSDIAAIWFRHRGREVLGFHFAKDTIHGFFDSRGENLRKVFLKAPLEFVRITSRFSHSRLHPIHRDRRPHYGTDYAAPHGTPILAVGDGVVTQARYSAGNGNYVRIRHNAVYETQYLHMSRFATGIRPGTQVSQGQVIGYVGSTGAATGPHVCFRFWKNGQQVDHLREEFPSADPLPKKYFEAFSLVRDSLRVQLDNIPLPAEPV